MSDDLVWVGEFGFVFTLTFIFTSYRLDANVNALERISFLSPHPLLSFLHTSLARCFVDMIYMELFWIPA